MTEPSLFDLGPVAPPAPFAAPPASGPVGVNATSSLYRKHRPQSFAEDDLVGQEHVVRTLRNAIRLDRIAHAYLFCGPRGTGKTTTARLLAKAVNCLDPDPANRPCNRCASCNAINANAATDVIEIDAASNRGIDDIRDLRERVKYAPTQLKTKFYIIDEAHQITGPAANAFLKTLEEPPAHTKFVLATTDPEELLPTIVSRCQRFDFRRIGLDASVARLRTVAAAEGLTVDDDAFVVIARHATGSLRDALGLLDQLSVYREDETAAAATGTEPITAAAVRALLGVSRNDRVESLVAALVDRDAGAALGAVNTAVEAGEDPRQLNRQLVTYLRVLLHERAGGSPDADERARAFAARFELTELAVLAARFAEIDYKIKHSPNAQLPLEVALVESVLRHDRAASAEPVADPRRAIAASTAAIPAAPAQEMPPVAAGIQERSPTTSLRDRVRGTASAPPVPQPASVPPPSIIPPTAPEAPPPTFAAPAITTPSGALDLERLVDLWPRVRQDVKAVNRRIEALLSSIDPFAVQNGQVTLAAAYEFHRNRLNADEVRAVVEDTIGRLTGAPVRVTCVLRNEVAPPAASPLPAVTEAPAPAYAPDPVGASSSPIPPSQPNGRPASEPPEPPSQPPPGRTPDDDDRRLQAAKNIFDADVIVG